MRQRALGHIWLPRYLTSLLVANQMPDKPHHKLNDASHKLETGVSMSDDDVEIFKRFRAMFLPDARITAQETYAKWLFGLTTTIAALGTGLSNTAFSKLSVLGSWFYAIGIVAAGIGLGLAAWALSEELEDANWQSRAAMQPKLVDLMKKKRTILRWATGCLAASLVLAAIGPLATAIQSRPSSQESGITARISARTIEAGISVAGLRPGTPAKLEMYSTTPLTKGKRELIAVFVQDADDAGKISYKAPEFKLSSAEQSLQLTLTYNGEQKDEQTYTIPQETLVPDATSLSCDKPSGTTVTCHLVGKNLKSIDQLKLTPKTGNPISSTKCEADKSDDTKATATFAASDFSGLKHDQKYGVVLVSAEKVNKTSVEFSPAP